jgi:hypothetical protein
MSGASWQSYCWLPLLQLSLEHNMLLLLLHATNRGVGADRKVVLGRARCSGSRVSRRS